MGGLIDLNHLLIVCEVIKDFMEGRTGKVWLISVLYPSLLSSTPASPSFYDSLMWIAKEMIFLGKNRELFSSSACLAPTTCFLCTTPVPCPNLLSQLPLIQIYSLANNRCFWCVFFCHFVGASTFFTLFSVNQRGEPKNIFGWTKHFIWSEQSV